MPGVVLFFVALMVMVVESVALGAFSIQMWALQTPLMIAIYLGLEREFVSGGLILVALMLPVEWLVGGVYGLYSIALAVIYLSMRPLRPNLQTDWGLVRGAVAAAAAVLHGAVMLVALFLIGEGGTSLSATVAVQMWWAVPVVAIGTVGLGKAFARLDGMMDPRKSRSDLEF